MDYIKKILENEKNSVEITFESHWQQILEYFRFNKVLKVMVLLNWKWLIDGTCDGDFRIPTLEEIKTSAKTIAKKAFDENRKITLGGFQVTYNKSTDMMDISFSISHWTTLTCAENSTK